MAQQPINTNNDRSLLERGGATGAAVGGLLGGYSNVASGYQTVANLRGKEQSMRHAENTEGRAQQTHEADLSTRYMDLAFKSRELQQKEIEVERLQAGQKAFLNQAKEQELLSEARLKDLDSLLGEGASKGILSNIESMDTASQSSIEVLSSQSDKVVDQNSYNKFLQQLNQSGVDTKKLGLDDQFQGEKTMLTLEALSSMAKSSVLKDRAKTLSGAAFKRRITREEIENIRQDFSDFNAAWNSTKEKISQVVSTPDAQVLVGEYGSTLGTLAPEPSNVSSKLVKTDKDTFLINGATGEIIERYDPRAPSGTTVNIGDKKEVIAYKKAVERLDTKMKTASDASRVMTTTLIARDTAPKALTGPGAESINWMKGLAKTAGGLLGVDIADQIDTQNANTIKNVNERLLFQFLSAEDAQRLSKDDRETARNALGGLSNDVKSNIAMTHILEGGSLSIQDEAAMYSVIMEQWGADEVKSDAGFSKNFAEYTADLPRFKGKGADITAVNDGRDLWKYYLEGRPNAFVFQNNEGKQVSRTVSQLKADAKAKNYTFREYLARLDALGVIAGTR